MSVGNTRQSCVSRVRIPAFLFFFPSLSALSPHRFTLISWKMTRKDEEIGKEEKREKRVFEINQNPLSSPAFELAQRRTEEKSQ